MLREQNLVGDDYEPGTCGLGRSIQAGIRISTEIPMPRS
jgi:hypothetical protein